MLSLLCKDPGRTQSVKEESVTDMWFDYFYEEQSESFSFYRIPKILFTEESFDLLSAEAKVVYGLLLDLIGLSRENGWTDDLGRVYVYCSMETIMKKLRCGKNKACRLLKELEDIGLIERKKQGFCKPAQIYVKNFIQSSKWGIHSPQNREYGVPKIGTMESLKQGTNNTKYINNEINNTNPILSGKVVENCSSGKDEDMDERNAYLDYLYDKLDANILYERFPYDKETIDGIIDLMLDTICSKRSYIRIAGDDKPAAVVRSQFMKLDHMHIEYVLDCLKKNKSKVRNIKQYLLATLYNAPMTMKSYMQAWVNNDMAEGNIK